MERRLAAVMIADVCGYGLLSQADEEGTRLRFQADLHELFEQSITAHRGRLIKTMGDGLLVEFHSVVEAVRCAVEVQRTKSESRDVDERRLEFRIAINLGDVIVEDDDIQGDGVIIASRLQCLAEPGGVIISGTVYDQVEKRLDVGFVFLGEQRLKHIEKPVRTYRVVLDQARANMAPAAGWRRRHWAAFAASAAALGIAAVVIVWQPWGRSEELVSIQPADLSSPDKPSIAVLPFDNESDDPKQEYFVDGMTDGLVTELAQISGLFVIARNSTFAYKGKEVTPKQVSAELGVRYVLEGSVQRAGEAIRINAQLIDAYSGGHIWAARFDGTLAGAFALQDEVAHGIADALTLRLTPDEQLAFSRAETTVPAAFDAFLRGWEHYRRTTPEDFAKALPYFEEAIALDPAFGRAYAASALVYARIYMWRWHYQLGISRFEARAKARQNLRIAQYKTALAYQAAALLSEADWQHNDALAELKEAIALEPGDPWSYALMAFVLASAGRPAEAMPHIRTAIRLDPYHPSYFMYVLALTEFGLQNFAASAAAAKSSIKLNPEDESSFLLLAAASGQLGLTKEAEDAVARFNALQVGRGGTVTTVSDHRPQNIARPRDGSDSLCQGLRLAGVPETFMSSDFARGNKLTDNEVRSLFLGNRLHGRMFDSGEEHEATISKEGIATLTGDWASVGGGHMADAEVRFEGDTVCFLWLKTANVCGTVLRNPGGLRTKENEFIWYYGDRAFTFSRVQSGP